MTTYPLNRYLNIRWAHNPSFAADGMSLIFVSDISGEFQVWQVDLGDDEEAIPWPQQLTFSADRVRTVQFSPIDGDTRLLYGHDAGGSENIQLSLLDASTGEEQLLTKGFESAMHVPGDWSPRKDAVLFAANRDDPSIFDLYAQPLNGEPAHLLWRHGERGFLANPIWSPDDKKVAFLRRAKSAEHDLFELDVASGDVRQLNPAERPAAYTDIAYSRDGRYLFVLTDLDSDFLHISRLELHSGDWETLVAPNADIEQIAYSPDGRYLAYVTNRDGDSRLDVIDLAVGLSRPAPEPDTRPGVIAMFGDHIVFDAVSQRLAFSYSSATRTSDIYVWNIDPNDDAVMRATDSSHGGIPVSQFVSPTQIHYRTFDDEQIPAFLYKPQQDSPMPVVIMVHGGPESQFRPDFRFLVQYFVHNGFAVLAPNVRGSTGYGNRFMHLDNVEKRMDSVTDLAHAAYWLREQPDIDSDRLVVYGGSYGGFMVLSALTTYPDLWAAGIDIVGISSFVTFLENTSEYRRAHRESEYGSLAENRDFLESISPLNHVDKIAAPLMIIHGANDPRVPLSEAQQLAEAVAEHDVPVELLVFEDEGHGISKLENRKIMYPAIIDFLEQVLA